VNPLPGGSLRGGRDKLIRLFSESLLANAFNNRFTLHPRRFAEMAVEEADAFLGFLDSRDSSQVFGRGLSLARQGMGEKSLLSLMSSLRIFCREELAERNREIIDAVRDAIEIYSSSLLLGFIDARESQVLTDQEELRRALSTALQEQSRELLVRGHAIATSINGIMFADLDGRVTYVNPSFLFLWGYRSSEEVVGALVSDVLPSEEARAIIETLPRTGGWRGELEVRRKDGEALTVTISASLIKNEAGTEIGIMTSFMDTTESRRLQDQMQQLQKMEALGQLAGGIAHDFNNLLTVISGYLQLLLLEAAPETSMHQDMLQIKAAVDRGAGLTKQLRYFTRQANGKREVLNLNDIAQETSELFRRTFPPDISVVLALAPTLWAVEADPNQMSQVLVNLCVNARDAITERGGAGAGQPRSGLITIRTENVVLAESEAKKYAGAAPGNYVLLRVSDTGVGMPPKLLEKLFIPFVTTKAERRGTGLGLAVVYGIVHGNRGFIDVASSLGVGSTFSVHLPMAERAAEAVEGGAEPVLAGGTGAILLVDDEPQVRDLMTRTLDQCGYRVLSAPDGRSALALYEENMAEIDLVILDMIMPIMGGRETFLRIRAADPALPVLIITGYTTDGLAYELARSGATSVVEKPLDLGVFTEKVRELIRKHPPRKQAS
jgi:two-component system cell cycle sensor histidine kinase/response regulator CckA